MAVDKKIIIDFQFINDTSLDAIEKTKKAILDLKVEREKLRLQGKEESKEYILLEGQLANLTKTLKTQQKELQNNLKAMEAGDGSIKALREQLKSLLQTYDALGEDARKSEFGQNMQKQIETITNDLKKLEEETGRAQRSVGDYEGSIRRALSEGIDTTPLKTQLRQLAAELQALTLQQRQLKDTMSQTTDPAEYAKLEEQYNKLGAAINDTAAKAGMLKDTVEDTGKIISAQADDYPAISALNEGITALVDSYTVLKGVTTALGIENDRLLDVMAKVQVLQQSVNALNRIAIALDKAKNGSLAIQQTSFWKLVTAKMADQKASLAQAKANATLATSEGAATLGANGLRRAMIALKATFMSIPGIGWIAAAGAALVGLMKVMGKVAEKSEEMKKSLEDDGSKLSEIYSDVDKEVGKAAANLSAMGDMALQAANGSKEQEYWVKKIADETGLSYDWLIKHTQLLPTIIQQYTDLARANAAFNKGIEYQADIDWQKRRFEELSKQLQEYADSLSFWRDFTPFGSKSDALREWLEDNVDEAMKGTPYYNKLLGLVDRWTVRGTSAAKEVGKAIEKVNKDVVRDSEAAAKDVEKLSKERAEAEIAYNETVAEAQKKNNSSITKTNQTTAKAIESIWQKLYSRTLPQLLKSYDKETDDMMKDMVKNGVDAGTQAVYAAQRALGRANVIDTFAKESKTMLADVSKDITALFDLLGNLQQKRAMEFGAFRIEKRDLDAKDRENLSNIMNKTLEIIAGYEGDFRERLSNLLGFGEIEFDEKGIAKNLGDIQAKISSLESPEEFEEFIQRLRTGIRDINREVLKGDTDIDKANSIVLKDMQDFLSYLNRIKELSQTVLPYVRNLQLEFSKLDTVSDTAMRDMATEINTALAEIYGDLPETVGDITDIELKIRAKLDEQALEQAQIRLDNATAKLRELEETPVEIRAQWGEGFDKMMDEAKAAVAQAEMEMNKTMHDARVRDLKDAEQTAKEKKQAQVDSYMAIGQAASDAFGSLSQMFDQLAEQDSRYAKFSKAFALMQILTSTAMSIASAVQGASAAGAATGVAAPFTTPAFIAEMIAIVLSAIASATSLLSQAKMPHFAYGGYVDMGTTSKADDVPAMVSRGEYIVQADAVKMYGKDYFDSLNAGLVRGDMDIAGALRSALADMPSPIVSVKEINNMQNRVRVKEDISRGRIN